MLGVVLSVSTLIVVLVVLLAILALIGLIAYIVTHLAPPPAIRWVMWGVGLLIALISALHFFDSGVV